MLFFPPINAQISESNYCLLPVIRSKTFIEISLGRYKTFIEISLGLNFSKYFKLIISQERPLLKSQVADKKLKIQMFLLGKFG